MAIPPGARKTQILITLAHMLEQPHAARITTAALASRMQVSEAALYRHFASKAQMFEGLIAQIETDIYGLMDGISAGRENGAEQARHMVAMLLGFAQTNRGMTRVLTGDALVTEDNRLLDRINQITERVQSTLCQAVRNAIVDGSAPANTNATLQACVLTHFVLGKWLRFAQSGWRLTPTDDLDAQLAWLLPAIPQGADGTRHNPDHA